MLPLIPRFSLTNYTFLKFINFSWVVFLINIKSLTLPFLNHFLTNDVKVGYNAGIFRTQFNIKKCGNFSKKIIILCVKFHGNILIIHLIHTFVLN